MLKYHELRPRSLSSTERKGNSRSDFALDAFFSGFILTIARQYFLLRLGNLLP